MSSPHERIATTTVVAREHRQARMLSGEHRRPTARAYSSSFDHDEPRPNAHVAAAMDDGQDGEQVSRNGVSGMRIEPKRYFIRLAEVPSGPG